MAKRKGKSLTEEVASQLEKGIFKGDYPPNMPLPSTRSLAEEFHVSQRVILSALDLLEKKDILVRQERKKVYVKARNIAVGAKEILLFAAGDNLAEDSIYSAIHEMILDNSKEKKYDFFCRILSCGVPITKGRLEREVARLGNLGFIDCAIFYGFFTEEEILLCQTLPYPVIFLGELPNSGVIPKGTRLLSPDSSKRLLAAGKYAVEKKASFLALFYYEKAARNSYEKEAMKTLALYLAENRIGLKLFSIDGDNIEEAGNCFEKSVKEKASTLPAGTLLVMYNLHSDSFASGDLLPAEEHPFLRFVTLDHRPAKPRIPYIVRDFQDLQKALMEEIECSDMPSAPCSRHRIIDFHYTIEE